jgi:hypothetical protein
MCGNSLLQFSFISGEIKLANVFAFGGFEMGIPNLKMDGLVHGVFLTPLGRIPDMAPKWLLGSCFNSVDMANASRVFKIAVLDDNPFYKNIFTRQLNGYAETLSHESGRQIKVQSFVQAQELLDQLDPETDMAFIDYYLDHGLTASDIMPTIRLIAPKCTVVIISRSLDAKSALRSPLSAAHFILKDNQAFVNSTGVLRNLVMNDSAHRPADVRT